MEDFIYRHRNISILAAVLVAQFVLLGYQVRRNDDVRLLRVWAVAIIMPIQKVIGAGTGFFSSGWNDYVFLRDVRLENEQLRGNLDQLKLEHQQLRRLLARFEREEELLAYQKQIPSQTVLASVIAAGANPNAKELFVNKGTSHGIQPGMAVITPDGVVGKIQAAFASASLVLLVNDVDNAVGVIEVNSREHGVMKGTGRSECRVDYIGNEVEIPVGAELYTSGDDRIYPKGLPVGVVTSVEPGVEFQRIYARPFAALSQLEEVLIVAQGVHQTLPQLHDPQAPARLMPMPESDPDPLTAPGVTPAPAAQDAESGAPVPDAVQPSSSEPLTDADLLEQRYRAIGAAQGHVFGEGLPGSRPPNFNLGITPPPKAGEPAASGRTKTAAPPSAAPPASTSAPGAAAGQAGSSPAAAASGP